MEVNPGNKVYHSVDNCIIETATKTLIARCKNSLIPADGSVTSIGNRAFYVCKGLISISIPDSVTSIGSSAFDGCTGLTSISIPDSVTSIGEKAFRGCKNLRAVWFSGTKKQWKKVKKGCGWDNYTPEFTVSCTDGTIRQ